MKRTVIGIIGFSIIPSCGLLLDTLVAPTAARDQIPAHIRALCSPLFRDADLRSIVIELNAARDEEISKSAAITGAGDACSATAAELLTIADAVDLDFDQLTASQFDTDCVNCYIALIDAIYD